MDVYDKVYTIVLNYNNADDTITCLESLLNLDYPNNEILVIDNASTDDSSNIIQCWINDNAPKIVFIESKINQGYASGNNIGIRYAEKNNDYKYVWILNNDTIVTPSSLAKLVEKMNKNDRIGICGSKLVYEWDKEKVQGYGGKYNKFFAISYPIKYYRENMEMDYVIGASMLVRRSFIEEIGLLNEKYFLYFEELDWAYRGKNKYILSCAPKSVVYHKEGGTINKGIVKKSYISDYYAIRNKILFTKRYHPFCLVTLYGYFIISLIYRLCTKRYFEAKTMFSLLCNKKDSALEDHVR